MPGQPLFGKPLLLRGIHTVEGRYLKGRGQPSMIEDNMALEGVMCMLPFTTYRTCKIIGANFLKLVQDRGVSQAPALLQRVHDMHGSILPA